MAIKLRLESKGIKNELSDINRLIEKMEGQHTLNIAGQAKLEALNKVAKELNKELVKMYEDKATKSNPYLRTQQNLEKLKRTTQEYIQLKKKESDGTITKTEVAQLKEKEKIIRICNQQIGKYGTESQKAYRNEINSSKKVQLSIQNEIKAIKQKAEAQQQAARQEEANQKRIAQLKKDYEKSVNTEKSYVKKQEKSDHYNKAGVKQTNSEEFNTNEALKVERDLQAQILQELRERGVAENEINELIRTRNNQIGYQQKTVSQKAQYEDAIKLTKEQYEIEKRLINLKADPKQTKFHQEEIAALEKELEATKKLKEEKLAANENGTELTQDQKKYQQELESSLQRSNELYKAQRKDIVNAKNATSELGDTIKKVFNYVLVYKGFQLLSQGIQQAVNTMKELDKAFTDIQMVTGDSDEATAELAQEYNALAKQMGSTTKEVAEGASEWLRQGKTASETTELLKASMTLSKVGAIESSQATELLTSSLNGYKVAAEDAMSIVDKISAIDLEAATSSEELAVALARTANSANDAGVSFDKLLAMIGTTSSVTRKSASTIGESFKTIFARMSNVAAGKDTDDEGESLNDVEKTLNKLNIKLRDSVGEWRSFEGVLDEVAEKWNNGVFNDVEKSQIATAIAGVRQQENFRALMNNWDEVRRLTDVAANSTGSASQKMETYLDGVEAKTNQLKATWENFIMSLNQSDSYKDFLDLCIWLLNNLPTVIGYITALFIAFKGYSIVTKVKKQIGGLIDTFKMLKGAINPTTLAIGALIAVLTYASNKIKEAEQANIDRIKKTEENIKKINEEKESLSTIEKKYTDVINSTKTFSEKRQELQTLQSELNALYEKEAKSIDLVNGSYENQISTLQNLSKEKDKEKRNEYQKTKSTRDNLLSEKTSNILINDSEMMSTQLKQSIANIAEKNNSLLVETVSGGLKLESTGRDLVKIYEELTELQQQLNDSGQVEQAQQLANIFENRESTQWLSDLPVVGGVLPDWENLQESYEKYKDSWTQEQESNFADFQEENQEYYDNYAQILSEIQTLKENYNNASTKQERKAIVTSLRELENSYYEAYDNIYFNSKGVTSQIRDMLDETFGEVDLYVEEIDIDWTRLGTTDSNVKKELADISKELETTGSLSEESRNKLTDLFKMVYSTGEETWIESFRNELEKLGISVEDLENKLSFEKLKTKAKESESSTQALKDSLEDAKKEVDEQNARNPAKEQGLGDIVYDETVGAWGKQISKEFGKGNFQTDYDKRVSQIEKDRGAAESNYNSILEQVQAEKNEQKAAVADLLEKMGEDTTLPWYQDIVTQFENEELNYEEFITKVEEYLEERNRLNEEAKVEYNEAFSSRFNYKESIGTDDEFAKIPEQLEKLEGYRDTLADGGTLDYESMNDLAKDYDSIAEKVNDKQKVTAKDIQDIMDEMTESTNEDLDEIEEYFDDAISYIDDLVANADFGDDFQEKVDDAYEIAKDTLEKGEDLDFIDPSLATDTGALTDLSRQLEALEDDYNTGRSSVDDYNSGLFDLAMEASDASTQAALLSALLTGENGLALNFDSLNQSQLQALASLAGYQSVEEMTANTDLITVLTNLGTKWNELDQDQQNALGSLLNYIYQYNNAPTQVKDILAEVTGGVKAIAYSGKINTNVRRVGTSVPKKKGSSGGSKNKYSAEDAAKDLADILEDIKDYEADIELDLEDQTEQLINHYNLEKNKLDSLKEELDYYEGIYDSVEDTTKWLETQQKLLENQSKTVEALQKSNDKIEKQREKIYKENSKYKVSGWFDSEGNETLAYGDLINSFEYKRNQIQKDAAKEMRKVYNSVSKSKSEKAIENAKEKIEEIEKEADKKIEALEKEQEKVENIHDSVSELNDAWEENQEAIRDALADMHDRIIDIRDTLVDQMMEQLEKAVDKQNESIEKDVTRMEQLVSIREKYYDILNETIDTQAELDSELQSSLDSFEYLDEQMRQLMFNEEDYKVLSETLNGIQEDIAGIWEEHYNKIDSLTDDEMYKAEYITAETERQLEMKMQEYELAKAELDVAKARTNLQNVQNERNVRMFVNGQWSWVANPEDVKNAQQQLADAEREKDRIEREQEQQKLIDSMNQIIDSDNLQIDENNELLERVQEAIEAQTQEVQSIEQALENIANTDLPAVGDVLQGAFGSDGKSGWISELLQNINKSTNGLMLALKGYNTTSAEKALKSGNLSKSDFEDLVESLGYSFNSSTGKVTTPDGSFSAHYKGWKKQSNSDTQLGTAANGVQVTGKGNSNSSGGSSSSKGFPRTGHVSTSSLPLRIRSGAGTSYKVLGTMPKGAKVTITGEVNSSWAKVKYKGINGYASRKYLTYDQGGLATGKGVFLKDINVPERILSPKQTKSFDYLVKNLTTNPILAALTKNPNVTSNLNGLGGAIGETKQYYFSNFTVQADNLTEFIDSLNAMIPISRK